MAAVPPLAASAVPARLDIAYRQGDAAPWLAQPNVLAVIGFGAEIGATDDPRLLSVPLQPLLAEPAPLEIWQIDADVRHGRDGDLSWASGGDLLLLAIRVDEEAHDGIDAASDYAYRRLLEGMTERGHHHLLRAWNYLADINLGEGDDERYRHFSIGRARGMGRVPRTRFPAATAIGRIDGVRELVIYVLAGRSPGQPVENPRQVSAYQYPRRYGPVPPSFARGMRLMHDHGQSSLLISGTSSVRGHETVHADTRAQIDETLINLDSLAQVGGFGDRLPLQRACLKAYLREAGDALIMREALIGAGLPPAQLLCLHGDICRADLIIEIDGITVLAPR